MICSDYVGIFGKDEQQNNDNLGHLMSTASRHVHYHHYRDHVSNTWKPTAVTSQRQEPRSYDIHTTDGSTLSINHRDIHPTTPSIHGPDIDTSSYDLSLHSHPRDVAFPTSPLIPGEAVCYYPIRYK